MVVYFTIEIRISRTTPFFLIHPVEYQRKSAMFGRVKLGALFSHAKKIKISAYCWNPLVGTEKTIQTSMCIIKDT